MRRDEPLEADYDRGGALGYRAGWVSIDNVAVGFRLSRTGLWTYGTDERALMLGWRHSSGDLVVAAGRATTRYIEHTLFGPGPYRESKEVGLALAAESTVGPRFVGVGFGVLGVFTARQRHIGLTATLQVGRLRKE
jgi:hypothetical protein